MRHFAAFKGAAGLASVRFQRGSDFIATGDARTSYTETFTSEQGSVRLTWAPLGEAFMVELPQEKSATSQHEMFSLFVNASGVAVSIDSHGVAGRPFPREMAGKASSTAFLAFSETWVRRPL